MLCSMSYFGTQFLCVNVAKGFFYCANNTTRVLVQFGNAIVDADGLLDVPHSMMRVKVQFLVYRHSRAMFLCCKALVLFLLCQLGTV